MTEESGEAAESVAARVDALLPRDIAAAAERVGEAKAALDATTLLALAVLAGAFIGLGAMFSATALAGAAALPFGVVRVLGGVTFSLGLVIVVIGGAELFTGDCLMVMALAARRITPGALVRAWTIVYVGNFIGAVGTAALVFLAGQHEFGAGEVGRVTLTIARAKAELGFGQAVVLGVLCNVLVCLAVWLSLGARRISGKVLVIVPPITAFVAAGFEHSIANMYYFPLALLLKASASAEFWTSIAAQPADFAAVTVRAAVANLIPVTIGNVIGGAGLVGLVYWFIYLRRDHAAP
ncbi:MAG: formate/nitrite transporter family protein [Alphaproteobacteria bacterium]